MDTTPPPTITKKPVVPSDTNWIDEFLNKQVGIDLTKVTPAPPFGGTTKSPTLHGQRGCNDHTLDDDEE